MACPNLNSPQWKALVAKIGTFEAFREFIKNDEQIPDANNYPQSLKGTNATLKIVQALATPKMELFYKNQYLKGNKEKFFNELAQVAGKQQTELLKEHLKGTEYATLPEMIAGLLAEMSYTIEINTAKGKEHIAPQYDYETGEYYGEESPGDNTQYYSILTVPGGTNGSYREQNFETPLIKVPKSHAQFNTENTIGFSRNDDRQIYTEKDVNSLLEIMKKSGILKVNCG